MPRGITDNEALLDRWLNETRSVADTLARDRCAPAAEQIGAVLHQAAALVQLVHDGFAVSVNVSIRGREIVRVVRDTPT